MDSELAKKMSDKAQFDAILGGTEALPPEVTMRKFVAARAQEIAALTQAIEHPQRTGQVFQKLPKHMRRRAMGHNAKRMPRRLREAHMHLLEKSGLPPKPKRPSRKYRRRPTNLLLEYNRRQKENIWLETHIWHAKRFHMVNKWGYKLAHFPNDKSFRACYRATAQHCLLQDISYYCCIELVGSLDGLLDGLQKLTNTECGLTFASAAFLDGTREGCATIFHSGMYPCGAIGPVTFLWKPGTERDTLRTIWIWSHPSFYKEILDEFISIFSFKEIEKMDIAESAEETEVRSSPVKKKLKLSEGMKKVEVEHIKLAIKNVPFTRMPKYQSVCGKFEMFLLKDVLNRFRLTGPLSTAVLLDALYQTVVIDEITASYEDTANASSSKSFSGKIEGDWWSDYYAASEHNRESWHVQKSLWESLKGVTSSAQLPPHFVLGLVVKDPRLQMPMKRAKAVPDENALWDETSPGILTPPQLASNSPIWSSFIRDQVTYSKMSTAEIAKLRSQNLVPGVIQEEIKQKENCCVPLLLLQRPGSQEPRNKRLGYSSGWDVICPAGWGMPLWLAFIFRGARAGGLREVNSVGFESGSGPVLAPDTAAGKAEEEVQEKELKHKYFRLPPSKRPNYIKFGITSPFICRWDFLAREWSGKSSWCILRERKKLEQLKAAIASCDRNKNNSYNSPEICDIGQVFSDLDSVCYFVPVTVHALRKGNPSDNSIICLPTNEDISFFIQNGTVQEPVEPVHPDENQKQRKEARNDHKKLLKRLRRQRIREKRREEENQEAENVAVKKKGTKEIPTKELVTKQANKMCSLWLPETTAVKESCSRSVMGFVAKGDFSFTEALGVGQGYVSLEALIQLVQHYQQRISEQCETCAPWVLLRNTTSYQYRVAILQL